MKAAREVGATGVWTNLLFLRPGTREHFLEHLAHDSPVPCYEELYRGRAYLGSAEGKPVRKLVPDLAGGSRSPTAACIPSGRSGSPSSSTSRSDVGPRRTILLTAQ